MFCILRAHETHNEILRRHKEVYSKNVSLLVLLILTPMEPAAQVHSQIPNSRHLQGKVQGWPLSTFSYFGLFYLLASTSV